jgi:Family of unknown function (DUF5302)
MTKSAKQGTSEVPAETAATQSAPAATDAGAAAAKGGADEAASEAANESAQDAAAVFEAAGDTHEDAAKPDINDVKAKFREALDRKQQAHAEAQGKGSHETGKVSGAHGPAASRRNFRRKSG